MAPAVLPIVVQVVPVTQGQEARNIEALAVQLTQAQVVHATTVRVGRRTVGLVAQHTTAQVAPATLDRAVLAIPVQVAPAQGALPSAGNSPLVSIV